MKRLSLLALLAILGLLTGPACQAAPPLWTTEALNADALPSHILSPAPPPDLHRMRLGLTTPQIPSVVLFQHPVDIQRISPPVDNSLTIDQPYQPDTPKGNVK